VLHGVCMASRNHAALAAWGSQSHWESARGVHTCLHVAVMGGRGMTEQLFQSLGEYWEDVVTIDVVTKSAFHRSRPVWPHAYTTSTSYSCVQLMLEVVTVPTTLHSLCLSVLHIQRGRSCRCNRWGVTVYTPLLANGCKVHFKEKPQISRQQRHGKQAPATHGGATFESVAASGTVSMKRPDVPSVMFTKPVALQTAVTQVIGTRTTRSSAHASLPLQCNKAMSAALPRNCSLAAINHQSSQP
jgi:hypothetical protein